MKDGCLGPRVKHKGGSIIIWECLTENGVGDLVRMDGILNAEKYRQILIHHAIATVKRLIGNCKVFISEVMDTC